MQSTLLTAGAKLDETRSIALRARERRCSAICCNQQMMMQSVVHTSAASTGWLQGTGCAA